MKNLIRKISQAALLMMAWPSLTQAITLSDIPLFLTAPVEPNIVMTLDDSGSMAWAFVPDDLSSYAGTKRFASSDFNSDRKSVV
jgi:type IV pilus assembly protein PilY1